MTPQPERTNKTPVGHVQSNNAPLKMDAYVLDIREERIADNGIRPSHRDTIEEPSFFRIATNDLRIRGRIGV